MTEAAFRKLALSMPGAVEAPHFERASFRVKKKIFATLKTGSGEAMIPVHPIEKCLALLASDPEAFIDHGGWTRKLGSLGLRLAKVDAKLVEAMMRAAFERVSGPKPKGRK